MADTHINTVLVVGWRCKRAPDACCASDPTSNVPPIHTRAERLASPPLRGSCSRPLFPDSLQLLNLYLFLHKFHFRAAVASASTSMGCILVRTAWRRGGVRLYRRAIREHPAPPDPPYRTFYDRSGHVKGNTRGGRHYHHSEGPTHADWPRHDVATPRQLCFLCRRAAA